MSSESDDDDDSVYLGTRMSRPRMNAMMNQSVLADADEANVSEYEKPLNPARMNLNAALPRTGMGDFPADRRQLGMWSEDAQPTIWDAVHYPREEEFEFESFFLRYQRQAEARAIIDKPVNDTWQDAPTVHDTKYDDEDEPKSEFETEIAEFFEGTYTRRNPLHRLNVADRLARLGEYSLLVIGTNDGRDLSTPLYPNEFDGLDDLNYLATFGQDRVEDINIVTDMTSERFRLPESFDVITEDADEDDELTETYQSEEIHWTRVIHIPEGTLEDDLRGTPALKPVFHELLNIDKIKAASGEGFWRAGYQGLLVQPPQDPRQSGNVRMEFSDDAEGVEEEINKFLNNFERTIATRAEVTSLEGSVHNPKPHLEANYESIAAALDLPKSILTGEDRADTASSEDVRQWHQKVGERRNSFAEPVILGPLIERFIEHGLLPQPEGESFTIEWQPLDEMTEMQQANLHSTEANAISTLAGGNPTRIASIGELRKLFGWGPEIGSEVPQSEMGDESELEVDESQLPDDSPLKSDQPQQGEQDAQRQDEQQQDGQQSGSSQQSGSGGPPEDGRQQSPESGRGVGNFSDAFGVKSGTERRSEIRAENDAGIVTNVEYEFDPDEHPRDLKGRFVEKPEDIEWVEAGDTSFADLSKGDRVVIEPTESNSVPDASPKPAVVSSVEPSRVSVKTDEAFRHVKRTDSAWEITAISSSSLQKHPRGKYSEWVERGRDVEPVDDVPGNAIAWPVSGSDSLLYRREPPETFDRISVLPSHQLGDGIVESGMDVLVQTSTRTITGEFVEANIPDDIRETRTVVIRTDSGIEEIPIFELETTPAGGEMLVRADLETSANTKHQSHPSRPPSSVETPEQFQAGGLGAVESVADDVNLSAFDDDQRRAVQRVLPTASDRWNFSLGSVTTDPTQKHMIAGQNAHYWNGNEESPDEMFFNPNKFNSGNDGHVSDTRRDIVLHETMHKLHYDKVGGENMDYQMSEQEERLLTAAVSEYSSRTPLEAVAETGLKLLRGERVDEHALRLYSAYGGPDL